ncbi:MAG: peptide chain release factor N(5)-glutamine methyltransferase [Parachlamydiaceae bacterium]
MKTLLEVVNLSIDFLEKKGIKNSRREALDLISLGLGIRPLDVYVQFDRPLNESELEGCRGLLKRRMAGEPFQYIRGEVDFFDCVFKVNPDVLIPRQETEILVDHIASILNQEELEGKVLIDLCCGSGCIGIALKRRFPALHVVLSDLSLKALAMARENARLNEVDVEFCEGNFLEPISGRLAHYFVCNPPYVSEEEYGQLEVEVREFEPKMALVAENKGLDFYQRLARAMPTLLQPRGKMWLEIGYQQGNAILKIFENCPAKKMELLQDWSGHDRFFFLENE